MANTRHRILELLENRRATTAPDIASALNLSQANIRHHLAVLAEQGLIRHAGQKRSQGRGRPVAVFARANRPGNTAALAGAFLKMVEDQTDDWLYEAAAQFVPQPASQEKHITSRLVGAMHELETLNYLPHWEAHPGAPEVVLKQCPFLEILDDHPEICRLDAFILERLTGETVEQTEKQNPDGAGNLVCRFLVQSQ